MMSLLLYKKFTWPDFGVYIPMYPPVATPLWVCRPIPRYNNV